MPASGAITPRISKCRRGDVQPPVEVTVTAVEKLAVIFKVPAAHKRKQLAVGEVTKDWLQHKVSSAGSKTPKPKVKFKLASTGAEVLI